MLNCSPWALLPLAFSALTAAGLWMVYFVAVDHKRVAPLGSKYSGTNGSLYPPYFSIAGSFPPASGLFSEVMNLAAFLGIVMAVLRYLQLKPRLKKSRLNAGSLVTFSLVCFGLTLVGNFQLLTEPVTHNLGTLMTFGLGIVYCWLQSYITLRVNIKNEGWKVGLVRLLLSGAITLAMILYETLQAVGYHVQGAQVQVALVMLFLIFLSTFAIEFRHCRFAAVCRDASLERSVSVSDGHSELSNWQLNEL